jgi:hypothetical protein
MNWQEVIDKYFCSYMRLVGNNNKPPKNIRDLYDFFDEQGIIIEIGVDWTMEPKYCYRVIRDYWGDDRQRKWSDLFYKRTQAEEQAFLRAFEILENKLK